MILYDMANRLFIRSVTMLGLAGITCMACMPAMAAEQPIGRLFSTPRERAALDQARQSSSKSRGDANTPVEEQLGDQITLDGFVRKNNGKTTVWVNQVPQHGRENSQGITIVQSGHNPSTISMQLPSGKNIDLKAGQTFDAANGKVNDVYDNASSVIKKTSTK